MSVYRDGKDQRRKGRRPHGDGGIDRIVAKLRENPGSIGDASRFSEDEMVILREAMKRVAAERIESVMGADPFRGKSVDKVFDREERP